MNGKSCKFNIEYQEAIVVLVRMSARKGDW